MCFNSALAIFRTNLLTCYFIAIAIMLLKHLNDTAVYLPIYYFDLSGCTMIQDVSILGMKQIPHGNRNWQAMIQQRPIDFFLHDELTIQFHK